MTMLCLGLWEVRTHSSFYPLTPTYSHLHSFHHYKARVLISIKFTSKGLLLIWEAYSYDSWVTISTLKNVYLSQSNLSPSSLLLDSGSCLVSDKLCHLVIAQRGTNLFAQVWVYSSHALAKLSDLPDQLLGHANGYDHKGEVAHLDILVHLGSFIEF